jgi:hypothetical protein
MTQRAGDGSVDCLTAVPAGHGEGQGGGVMDERRGRRPLKGGLTSRMRRIRPRLSSITVAASSYPGPPTGASNRCRWDLAAEVSSDTAYWRVLRPPGTCRVSRMLVCVDTASAADGCQVVRCFVAWARR